MKRRRSCECFERGVRVSLSFLSFVVCGLVERLILCVNDYYTSRLFFFFLVMILFLSSFLFCFFLFNLF